MARNPGDEDSHRRMVDIAPGHVLGAGEVVHLVAKDAVAGGSKEMKEQLGRGDIEDDGRTGGEAALRRVCRVGSNGVHGSRFILSKRLETGIFGHNSLTRHGKGYILGMLRLRARTASGARAPLSMTEEKICMEKTGSVVDVHLSIFCHNVLNQRTLSRETQAQTYPDQSGNRPALFQGHDEDAVAQAAEVHAEV